MRKNVEERNKTGGGNPNLRILTPLEERLERICNITSSVYGVIGACDFGHAEITVPLHSEVYIDNNVPANENTENIEPIIKKRKIIRKSNKKCDNKEIFEKILQLLEENKEINNERLKIEKRNSETNAKNQKILTDILIKLSNK